MSKYTIICWPDVQSLMDKPDFEENSNLVTNDALVGQYGSSAYFVNSEWLEQLEEEDMNEYRFVRRKKYTIWEEESFDVEATSLMEAKAIVLENPESYTNYTSDYEYLYDTVTELSVEDNDGEATVELFSAEEDEIIWTNK